MEGMEEKLSALFSSPESMAQIRRLADTLSGTMGGAAKGEAESPPSSGMGGGLDALDPRLMQTLLSILREYQAPSRTASLVEALRPWLQPERLQRLDQALRIARLTRAAKAVLPEWGGKRPGGG